MMYTSWLQAGVGLWYAQQHGWVNMAVAYQQLIAGLRSVQPAAFAQEAWHDGRDTPWLLEPRTAVLCRTLEVLHDPEQLGQLVERLEASSWLQQARQSMFGQGVLEEDAAKVLWVVDAPGFVASGGTVVEAGMQPESSSPSAAAAGGGTGSHRLSATRAAVSGSSGNTCDASPASRSPALALPPQALCALDLLARALLVPFSKGKATNLHGVIAMQDLDLLALLLQLGLPIANQSLQLQDRALAYAIHVYDQAAVECDRDKAAAAIEVSVCWHRLPLWPACCRHPVHTC
jgi:hypothetical protein